MPKSNGRERYSRRRRGEHFKGCACRSFDGYLVIEVRAARCNMRLSTTSGNSQHKDCWNRGSRSALLGAPIRLHVKGCVCRSDDLLYLEDGSRAKWIALCAAPLAGVASANQTMRAYSPRDIAKLPR
jgi:hypothetical protein